MADLNIGNSTANVIVNAKHNGAVNPQINNTYDLGTSTLRWKNIYGNLKGNALTVGQGNNPNIAQDANDLILNTPSKLTFYSFNINKLANIPSGGSNWGYLTVGSYGGNYSYQTFVDGYNGTTWTRILSAGTWGAWKTTLDSNNYTNYTVTKTGLGASGTWEISISGNASSASKVNNKLTVGSKTYDGSAAVTISASDLGLASAMLFLGTTTTAITDGATTNPVVLGGSNKTVTAGNVVLYGSKEFVWTGSAWEELGNEGSYKIVQAAVADPSASGTSNTFIATISQDTNGKITATKKTVAVTNSAPTLAWSTTSTIGTVAGTNLQVKMPANPNTDTKVTQTAINAADYTNWRPLVWGSSNSVTEGFTPSTVTDEVYTAQTLSCQPATGTIRATTFKGNLSGNATSATYTTQLLGVNGSNTPYDAIEGNLIRAVWNVEGDSRWYLKAGTYNCRVNYADSTDTSDTSNYLNINNSANCSYGLQYIQQYSQTSGNDLPSNTWWHVIKMNHGNGDTYYKRLLAFDFWNDNIMTSGAAENGKTRAWKQVWVQGNSITGAVWNDYAEYREADTIQGGRCVREVGDDTLSLTTKRLMRGCSITSDTWGFAQGETEKAKTPIAVAGRVLAYPLESRELFKEYIGYSVCSGPNGTVSLMTEEEELKYPWAIVGTVSAVPDYEEWGGGEMADRPSVKVNGRIWIKVK